MKQPDIENIRKWVHGELDETSCLPLEQWADAHPEEMAKLVAELEEPTQGVEQLPASMDVPYPDFFHAKLEQEIKKLDQQQDSSSAAQGGMSLLDKLKYVFMPVAGVAMVLCFFLGTQFSSPEQGSDVSQPVAKLDPVTSLIYVPSESVSVEQITLEDSSAILLDGLEPISDMELVMMLNPESDSRMVKVEESGRTKESS